MTQFPETLALGQIISRELKEEIERRYNTYITLEQQLAESEKQNVLLREKLESTRHWFETQATQVLKDCIICDAEPTAWMRDAGEPSLSTMAYCIPTSVKDVWLKVNPKNVERYTIPLYKAKDQK